MRKFSANTIFPISSEPIDNGVIITDDKGKIKEVINPTTLNYKLEDVEFHNGVMCPGFINTHCHLELSHLHNKVPAGNGLDHFIKEIEAIRRADPEEVSEAIAKAEAEMIRNGIVAVGDISNTNHSFHQKVKGNLKYHTFIELLGFHPNKAGMAFSKGLALKTEYDDLFSKVNLKPRISLTPHAPYSASDNLLELIKDYSDKRYNPISIHNQESPEENELFLYKKGKILDRLKHFGIDTDSWTEPKTTSLKATLNKLPLNTLQLVHNTFTTEEEVIWAESLHEDLYWCLCPNANLYIEKRLPNVQVFLKNKCKITVGTDSLASNHSLSILDELKVISIAVPEASLNQLLTWSTKNGAEFLGMNDLGTLKKGKTPGLILISDLEKGRLTEASKVQKLL